MKRKQNNTKKQNKETKTDKKENNSYKLNQKHVTSKKKHCFNVEKIHCRKTHCSVGLGTEKWKK